MDINLLKKCCSIAVFVYGHHKDGSLFLLCSKRAGKNPKFHGGEFNVPTGKVEEFDNNPLESAIREVKEETGIDITTDMIKTANFERYGASGEYLGANLKVVLPGVIGDSKIGDGDWENKKYNWLPFNPDNPESLNGKRIKWFYNQNQTACNVYKMVNESIYNKNRNNMRNRIRLSEGQLRRVIKESVYRILAEADKKDDNRLPDPPKSIKFKRSQNKREDGTPWGEGEPENWNPSQRRNWEGKWRKYKKAHNWN